MTQTEEHDPAQQLATLVVDQPRHVLDVGCGTGFLARYLVERVERVDAVDISRATRSSW